VPRKRPEAASYSHRGDLLAGVPAAFNKPLKADEVVVESRRGDFRDYAASKQYVAEGRVTEEELALLNWEFVGSAANQRTWDSGRAVGERVWRAWLERALSYEVILHVAGRAVVRGPEDSYRVEIYWLFDRKLKTHRVRSVHVIADDFLELGASLPVGDHVAALKLRLRRQPSGASVGVPRSRPAPGEPVDPAFYRRLLNAYDKLVSEGQKSPALELARRMDANHNTVKSWLRRGRAYLEED
jgi:hypothetical protein